MHPSEDSKSLGPEGELIDFFFDANGRRLPVSPGRSEAGEGVLRIEFGFDLEHEALAGSLVGDEVKLVRHDGVEIATLRVRHCDLDLHVLSTELEAAPEAIARWSGMGQIRGPSGLLAWASQPVPPLQPA